MLGKYRAGSRQHHRAHQQGGHRKFESSQGGFHVNLQVPPFLRHSKGTFQVIDNNTVISLMGGRLPPGLVGVGHLCGELLGGGCDEDIVFRRCDDIGAFDWIFRVPDG
jgi:hypothetical protein